MIRRPPRSPLFPYPTLSRSLLSSSSSCASRRFVSRAVSDSSRINGRMRSTISAIDSSRCTPARLMPPSSTRSEEHTSELQSPCNLVCRLLLEKKKQEQRATAKPVYRSCAHDQHPTLTTFRPFRLQHRPKPSAYSTSRVTA